MEKTILLVPVLLSILKSHRVQAAKVSMELKQAEYSLSLTPKEKDYEMEQVHQALLSKVNRLKSELATKKIFIQGLSEIYEDRQWKIRARSSQRTSFIQV